VVFSRLRERKFSNFAFIMKPKRTRSKKPAVIANSRWLAYATATTASAIACTPSAKAEIHYSGIVDHDFANGGFAGSLGPGATLDLNVSTGTRVGGGGFQFGAAFIRGTSQRTAGIFAGYGTGKAAYFWLSELPARAFLPTQRFGEFCRRSSSCEVCKPTGSCSCNLCYGTAEIGGSDFRAPGIGFIGFRFSHGGGETQYGWARVKKGGPPDYRFILVDYAWGDPGDRFFTGQTRLTPFFSTPPPRSSEQGEAAPKEGSLGWLALGAAGLLAWRKRRSRAAR
jgi:MYXO-CTERM domain-containing protein